MKIRSIIISISIVTLVIVLLVFFAFRYATRTNGEVLLQNGYADLKTGTTNNLEARNALIEKFVFDKSTWTELLVAINRKDSTWFNEEFTPSLKNFSISYLWALNKEGALVYSKDVDLNASIPFFDVDRAHLLDSLKVNPFRNFFVKFNGIVTQINIAPIQLNNDLKRLTKPMGFLICGRKFDSAFANEIMKVSPGCKIAIVDSMVKSKDTIQYKEFSASFQKVLKNFSGEAIATLIATKKFEIISSYNKRLSSYSILYIAILLGVLFIYYHFVRIKLLNPIGILSDALSKKDGSNLTGLKSKEDEFTGLANLVDDTFIKNRILKSEIQLRLKTENDLRTSAVQLENATIDKIRAEQDRIAKSGFLSTMSHEIRTPINGVIGVVNLLKSEVLTASQRELVDTLSFSSNHLLSILTDILDFSKIESGNLTFDLVQFNLNEICKNVTNLYLPLASTKNIAIEMKFDEKGMSEYFLGDGMRLCQILNNLIGNAIKFTEKGKVTLGYKLLEKINGKQTVAFTVEDSGIGIAADKLDTIFEGFSQADRSISTNYGGTGLGLTITKKLVELQGGNIAVTSILNTGTVFSFQLSFETVVIADYKVDKMERAQSVYDLSGLHVLVAEDNKINAFILNKFLDKWNVKMDLVVNGAEVIEKLKTIDYDVILMDLHMPVMDGKEAVGLIRNNKTLFNHNKPIVALTADATTETKNLILKSGFDQYVSKPFNPDQLYEILEKYAALKLGDT